MKLGEPPGELGRDRLAQVRGHRLARPARGLDALRTGLAREDRDEVGEELAVLLGGRGGVGLVGRVRAEPLVLHVSDAELLKDEEHRALVPEVHRTVGLGFLRLRELLHPCKSFDSECSRAAWRRPARAWRAF